MITVQTTVYLGERFLLKQVDFIWIKVNIFSETLFATISHFLLNTKQHFVWVIRQIREIRCFPRSFFTREILIKNNKMLSFAIKRFKKIFVNRFFTDIVNNRFFKNGKCHLQSAFFYSNCCVTEKTTVSTQSMLQNQFLAIEWIQPLWMKTSFVQHQTF